MPPAPNEPEPSSPPSDERRGRAGQLAWTTSTYLAEGLPWSLLHQIASEYLTSIGVSASQIGRTSYLHASLSLKVLWSPIVDAFGSLRTWMVGMQLAMGAMMGLLAVLAHRTALAVTEGPVDTTWIWAVLGVIALMSAMHDIACDGYYMEALSKDDQARYSGTRTAAFRAAMLIGSSGLVFLGGHVHWLLGFGSAAVLMLGLGVAHWLWLPRRHKPALTPAEASRTSKWKHIRSAYTSFVRQDQFLLVFAFLATYKMADIVMTNMSKVLLARELGVPTDLRGILNAFSLTASIAGAIAGGAWIARKSLAKTLVPITLAMAVTEPLFVALAAYAPSLAISVPGTAESMADIDMSRALGPLAIVATVIVIEQLCAGMALVAQMIFIMRRCHPDHKAAHYAFATAIYSTFQMAVGGESGTMYEAFGPVNYFWFASALTIPAVLLAIVVPKD